MALQILDGDLPPPYGVARLAACSQLPFVNVRVAILASGARVGEHQAYVACRACYTLMKTPKGKGGAVMIELQDIAKRFPGSQRVAVFARQVQSAVRAAGHTSLCLLAVYALCGQKQDGAGDDPTSVAAAH